MKHHHCHCGLKNQLQKLRAKKLGIVGVLLIGLHILFHVVECLVIPALLVAFSSTSDETTAATTEVVETAELNEAKTTFYAQTSLSYRFEEYYEALWSH